MRRIQILNLRHCEMSVRTRPDQLRCADAVVVIDGHKSGRLSDDVQEPRNLQRIIYGARIYHMTPLAGLSLRVTCTGSQR